MKKIALFSFLILITICSAYTTAWFYFAGIIDKEIARFVTDQKENNVIFDGAMSPAHGFPGKYQVVYTGDIMTPSGKITLPKLEISGIPLEGQAIFVHAPLGMTLQNRLLPDHVRALSYASLTFEIPTKFPPSFTYPYVKIWQTEGHAELSIPSLTLQWPDASIYGEGHVRLNDDLQPEAEATFGITNHTFFLDAISEEINLPPTQRLMALTFLNALNRENGAVIIPVKLQENALYLGMARITAIPFIFWPAQRSAQGSAEGQVRRGNPPVLPQ